MPDLDRQDAFLPGQSMVVLECSWRAGTALLPAPLGARTSRPHAQASPHPLTEAGFREALAFLRSF